MASTSSLFYLLLVFCSVSKIGKTANILVTVVGIAGSQNLIMYRLADLLGERGHNVTVLKVEVLPEAKSIPLKYAKEISYSVMTDPEMLKQIRSAAAQFTWTVQAGMPMAPIKNARNMFRQIRLACQLLLERQDFIQSLNDSHFDLFVIHVFDMCSFGLTKVLNIEAYVWMTTGVLFDFMAWYSGSPVAHSYVPNMMATPSDPMGTLSFLERMKNLIGSAATLGLFQYGMVGPYTEVFRNKYGPDFPHFDDILGKTQLYFTNSVPIFEYARPVSENVLNVGGLTMKKPEPLTEEWQMIMDDAPKEGVVVFSLGSIAETSTMPQDVRLSFLNAFKRFPHLFIWRFDGEFPEVKSVKNVLLANWLPQKDLMAHPKVKAAIIHGGYNSLTETTYMGVPVIVMPLWGDQFGNVVRVTRHNIGVKLDRSTLNEQRVYEALEKVLYNQTVQDSAKQLGQMIREKPFSSLQQATEWLEYLAKFKRLDQLQPQSRHLYLFQYLLLDITLVLLLILMIVFTIFKCCVKCCLKKCRKSNTDGDASKKKKE